VIALRRVHDHIDRHYAEPLTLTGLANLVGMSKFHLVRAFRAAYGETPMRYLSRRRIAVAQDLLRYANLTVTEICMLVGWTSLGSFSARFTELVGESPSAYQRRWAGRGPQIAGCHVFMRGVIPQFRRSPAAARGSSVDP
jgi:transcriptional regulator GlxA family with amidase domain